MVPLSHLQQKLSHHKKKIVFVDTGSNQLRVAYAFQAPWQFPRRHFAKGQLEEEVILYQFFIPVAFYFAGAYVKKAPLFPLSFSKKFFFSLMNFEEIKFSAHSYICRLRSVDINAFLV